MQVNSKECGHVAAIFILIVALVVLGLLLNNKKTSDLYGSKNHINSAPVGSFSKSKYSINDPASIWVVVNKGRKLPANYTPQGLIKPQIPLRLPTSDPEMTLRSDVATALISMITQATKDNLHLMLASAYRSYSLQESVYSSFVKSLGQAKADESSARPGHSEHQTGLAADLEPLDRRCEVEACFANTPEGKWLAANSYKYGFIIRYEKNKQNLTGYEYEPWHVRYVGTELASKLHETNQTMEQFFNLKAYTNYPAQPYLLK